MGIKVLFGSGELTCKECNYGLLPIFWKDIIDSLTTGRNAVTVSSGSADERLIAHLVRPPSTAMNMHRLWQSEVGLYMIVTGSLCVGHQQQVHTLACIKWVSYMTLPITGCGQGIKAMSHSIAASNDCA